MQVGGLSRACGTGKAVNEEHVSRGSATLSWWGAHAEDDVVVQGPAGVDGAALDHAVHHLQEATRLVRQADGQERQTCGLCLAGATHPTKAQYMVP